MKKRTLLMITLLPLCMLTACGTASQTGTAPTEESSTMNAVQTADAAQEEKTDVSEESVEEDTTQETEVSENVAGMTQEELPQIEFSSEGSEELKSEDGTVLLQFSESFPTVTIAGNKEASDKINQIYQMEKSNMDYSKQAYLGMAQSAYESQNQQGDFQPYQYDYTVTAGWCDSTVISFIELGTQFTGGDLPHQVSGAMNFDAETGARLKLVDITDSPDALKAVCREQIQEQCDSTEYQGRLFENYAQGIETAVQEGVWYFSEEGLSIICNEYVIADQDQGIFTFTIPYEVLKDHLKEKYVKQ